MDSFARLRLLRDSGVIRPDVEAAMRSAVGWLEKACIPMDSEQGRMFVTHVAMAVQRAVDGETIAGLSPDLMEEVKGSPWFPTAEKFLDFIGSLGVSLPESEQGYLLVHVCSLLQGSGSDEVRGRGSD